MADTVKPLMSDPPEMVVTILRVFGGGVFLFSPCPPQLFLTPIGIPLNVPALTTVQFQPSTAYNLSCNDHDHYEIYKIWNFPRRLGCYESSKATLHIFSP